MKTFVIDAENNTTAYTSATKHPRTIEGMRTFNTEKALTKLAADWPVTRLAEIWNTLPGVTAVKKFKDRATGVTRIWNAIQALEPAQETETGNADGTPGTTCVEAAATLTGTAREGSKRARVLELMRQPDGVTLETIMSETGWLKHTVRGFVSGSLVRKGVPVESFRLDDGQRAYRVQV
jgi:Protein of unknown function (DUF3489)